MIEFKFRDEESNVLGKVARPVADVYFEDKNGREIVAFMYIDSGADIVLIPRQFGEVLGFEIGNDKIEEIGGIGNTKIPIVIKKSKLRIGDIPIEAMVAWALTEEVPYLLGRINVFDKFNIEFRQKERKIKFGTID